MTPDAVVHPPMQPRRDPKGRHEADGDAPPPGRAAGLKSHESRHRPGQHETQPRPTIPAAEPVELLHTARQAFDVPAQSLQVCLLLGVYQEVKPYWIRKK